MKYFWVMFWFRYKSVKIFFLVCAGLSFVNMSFVMMEVNTLKLTKNYQLVENIKKLLASAGMEEEKDGNESSSLADSHVKELDVVVNPSQPFRTPNHKLSSAEYRYIDCISELIGHRKIFSPPPEA